MIDPHRLALRIHEMLKNKDLLNRAALTSAGVWVPQVEQAIQIEAQSGRAEFERFVEWWGVRAHYDHKNLHPQAVWTICPSSLCTSLRRTLADFKATAPALSTPAHDCHEPCPVCGRGTMPG